MITCYFRVTEMNSITFRCGDYDIELIGDECRIYVVSQHGLELVATMKIEHLQNALSTARMLVK